MADFFAIMAVISVIYYVYCRIKTHFQGDTTSFWLISAVVFSYMYFYTRYLGGIFFSALYYALLILVSAFIILVLFVFVSSFIISKRKSDASGYILFGADSYSLPKSVNNKRLEKLKALLSGNEKRAVLSGNGKTKEAIKAKEYLVSAGIPENRLITDNLSDTTLQNIVNTAKYIPDFAVITSRFHSVRVFFMYKVLYPDKKISIIGTEGELFLEIHLIAREIFCFAFDVFSGRMKNAKK